MDREVISQMHTWKYKEDEPPDYPPQVKKKKKGGRHRIIYFLTEKKKTFCLIGLGVLEMFFFL